MPNMTYQVLYFHDQISELLFISTCDLLWLY